MCDIKNIVFKLLITKKMNKYEHPKTPAVNGKDKQEPVEVENEKNFISS